MFKVAHPRSKRSAAVNQIINILINNYNMKSVRHITKLKDARCCCCFSRLCEAELCSSI